MNIIKSGLAVDITQSLNQAELIVSGCFKSHPQTVFQILDKLGEGTYGSVYKALHLETNHIYAIKICPLKSDEQVYTNEISFLLSVDHPFVVKLLDVYATDEELWLVLEHCELGSIANLLHITKVPFEEEEIAAVSYNVMLALEYLHSQKRMHRDVKPGNILINHWGHVKLADFGIASAKTQSNTFIGSPFWMAPEQAQKQNYDLKVDIWAFGICLLEMAELALPFESLHPIRALYAIQKRPQTKFNRPDQFSQELNDFLSLCLQCDLQKRANATELLVHPFILKHKPNFSQIRRRFFASKLKLIESCRFSMQEKQSNETYSRILANVNATQDTLLLSTDHSAEVQTMIEKSTVFVNDSVASIDNQVDNQPQSHFQKALSLMKKENRKDYMNKQSNTSCSQDITSSSILRELRDLSNTIDREHSRTSVEPTFNFQKKYPSQFSFDHSQKENIVLNGTQTGLENCCDDSQIEPNKLTVLKQPIFNQYDLSHSKTPENKSNKYYSRNHLDRYNSTDISKMMKNNTKYRTINQSNFVVRQGRTEFNDDANGESNYNWKLDIENESTLGVPSQLPTPRGPISNLSTHEEDIFFENMKTAREVHDNEDGIRMPLVFKTPNAANDLLPWSSVATNSKRSLVLETKSTPTTHKYEFLAKQKRAETLETLIVSEDSYKSKIISEKERLKKEMDAEIMKIVQKYQVEFEKFQ